MPHLAFFEEGYYDRVVAKVKSATSIADVLTTRVLILAATGPGGVRAIRDMLRFAKFAAGNMYGVLTGRRIT